ncbi:aldehyde dehydrogenase family protein [Staphylococcus saprophyticus]|uniref:aldehyde dehydrogenase family protein n=1 Tax=Staphylococcus saprophyticus TaxID=29385 RepID=UPI0015859F27|nr:aldehyde dehydrogenase family protein [Staphylococcus saprophyticus]MDW3888617.1 aldehyde dehydrogenase family protein [Staphylococcus saprophyticus]QKV12513.1 aldehyde dehydrogenase family protein [Staphylococcus saprophyticus]
MQGAKVAQLKWEKVNIVTRTKIVEELAEKLSTNKNELANIYVEEQGKSYFAAVGEIDKSNSLDTSRIIFISKNKSIILKIKYRIIRY